MAEVLYRMSVVREGRADDIDSVRHSKVERGSARGLDVLMEAERYWDSMAEFRRDRERNKKYCFGDQWSDIVEVDGMRMSEEQYIRKQGAVPLKNNLIRRLVRNVLGVYDNQNKEPVCVARDRDEQTLGETMSTLLQYNMQLNRMGPMYSRTMEEFLISGFVVHRKWYGWRGDKLDCWTDSVPPDAFFVDCNMRDFRGWDVTCLGEVHDVDFGTLCMKYAHSEADYATLAEIYSHARNRESVVSYCSKFGFSRERGLSFMWGGDAGLCRVIEVWRKERKPRYRCRDYNRGEVFKVEVEDYEELVEKVNRDRLVRGLAAGMSRDDIPLIEAEWFVDDYWYYYHLSPFGDILEEGETPYDHKSHPYVFKAYPFIDGEIHSFVGDVVDQQRYTNRLITMYDWIMRTSAKGLLAVPEEAIGKMDINEIADMWSRVGGVILVKTKNGIPLPQEISSKATNIGIMELLNLQLKFFEDVSGVNGALQGKPGYSSTSGALYAQQTQNATTSLLDLLESFSDFIKDAAYKDVKNIQQFYDTKRILNIVGRTAEIVPANAERVKDAEFDLSIQESTNSPAYRDNANAVLLQFWQAGQLSLEQLLEVGNFPFADALLQSLRSQQQQVAQGQAVEGVPADVREQIEAGADPAAVAMLQQGLAQDAA